MNIKLCSTYNIKAVFESNFIIFISLLLSLAVTQQMAKFSSKVGGEVMLPCVNGKDFHSLYNSTTWLFADSASKTTVALFERGQISKDNGSKSGRLSVTPNCSLLIKEVRAEDAGGYSCRQFISGQLVSDSWAYLFVTNSEYLMFSALTVLLQHTQKVQYISTLAWPMLTPVYLMRV